MLPLPGTIGSSSASAVLLELVHAGQAPAAILLTEPDAILLLGCIVAPRNGLGTPPALRLPRERQRALDGTRAVTRSARRRALALGVRRSVRRTR